ncbi:hypothetical protein AX774_g301 [Zancudomyces culisetae]|uniref:Uncharacterized protein n=1 Tax=Zancudomyces culisetae TaxID=1213189 RepID=A0A1R1PYX1_ZANCU|nr:hypothetical protein AX774_g301 [Zancudomyces culisetae]|eukprot:OMH86137.1 hypothetical protein AX774_g301 [Zancudomyces culisetae]
MVNLYTNKSAKGTTVDIKILPSNNKNLLPIDFNKKDNYTHSLTNVIIERVSIKGIILNAEGGYEEKHTSYGERTDTRRGKRKHTSQFLGYVNKELKGRRGDGCSDIQESEKVDTTSESYSEYLKSCRNNLIKESGRANVEKYYKIVKNRAELGLVDCEAVKIFCGTISTEDQEKSNTKISRGIGVERGYLEEKGAVCLKKDEGVYIKGDNVEYMVKPSPKLQGVKEKKTKQTMDHSQTHADANSHDSNKVQAQVQLVPDTYKLCWSVSATQGKDDYAKKAQSQILQVARKYKIVELEGGYRKLAIEKLMIKRSKIGYPLKERIIQIKAN